METDGRVVKGLTSHSLNSETKHKLKQTQNKLLCVAQSQSEKCSF